MPLSLFKYIDSLRCRFALFCVQQGTLVIYSIVNDKLQCCVVATSNILILTLMLIHFNMYNVMHDCLGLPIINENVHYLANR